MLKEGLDVTNLYTLVPLRAFAADILTEQTLGRGLRLPYGEKTGDPDVDKLTVIAHDRFDELIKAAQDENSIILKQTIIDIEDPAFSANQENVSVTTKIEEKILQQEAEASKIPDEEQRNQATLEAKVKRAVLEQLRGNNVNGLHIDPSDIGSKETTKQVAELVQATLPLVEGTPVNEEAIKKITKSIVKDFLPELVNGSIPIPRIVIQPNENSIKAGFKEFSLRTQGLPRFNPIHDEILIKTLQEQKDTVIGLVSHGNLKDTNENLIVAKLIDHDEVDYDIHHDLLYNLAGQMLDYLKGLHNIVGDVSNIVLTQREQLAENIWLQMKDHFFCEVGEYETPVVKPFTVIEPHNYTTMRNVDPKDFKVAVRTVAELKRTLFTGFKKACHSAYKFDTFGEQKLSQILEADSEKSILKWLRPAPRQFHIYWDHHTKTYEPDFVVETSDGIWLVEIKARTEIEANDTQEKARAALKYCSHATEYSKGNGGKAWGYILIPDEDIALNKTFTHLTGTYEVK